MTEGSQCNKCKTFIPKFKPAPKKEAKTVSKPTTDAEMLGELRWGTSTLSTYTFTATTTVPTTEKKETIEIDLCEACAKKLDKWLASSS